MREFRIAMAFVFVSLLGGCVPSLYSLYTDDVVTFDQALLGEWRQENANGTWVFTKKDEKQYKLVYTDQDGKQGDFDVHLLKLDGQLFLDFYPEESDVKQNLFYKLHYLPAHTFMIVRQIEPTLQMAPLNPKWLKQLLAENPHAIRHETVNDGIVLTAKPKELQAFVIKHKETPNAFIKPSNMKRKL